MWNLGSDWNVHTEFSFMNFGVEVFISRKTDTGVEVMGPDMMAQKVDLNSARPQPTMRLPEGTLQLFFDHLWEKGLRPKEKRYESEAELPKGQIALQGNHLEDMRKLVFKTKEEK